MRFLDFADQFGGKPATLAVFSTFQFDPDFFERRLLRTPALVKARRILVFMDAGQWLGLLHADTPSRLLNRRYLLVPVRPSGGVFHPKLSLLLRPGGWELHCGSNNLTRSGCSSNLELLNFLSGDLETEPGASIDMVRDALAFFRRACDDAEGEAGRIAREWLREVASALPWLADLPRPQTASRVHLVHTYTGPLWDQLVRFLEGERPRRIKVVSPFFDRNAELVHRVADRWPKCAIELVVQQETTSLRVAALKKLGRRVALSELRSSSRRLHAKLLAWDTGADASCLVGSANFTTAAFDGRNVEACLLVRGANDLLAGLFDSQLSTRALPPDEFVPGVGDEPTADELEPHALQMTSALLSGPGELQLHYRYRRDMHPARLRAAIRAFGERRPRALLPIPHPDLGTASLSVPPAALKDSYGSLLASLLAEFGSDSEESPPVWVIQEESLTYEPAGDSAPSGSSRIEESGEGLPEFLDELGMREGVTAVIEYLQHLNIHFTDGETAVSRAGQFSVSPRDPYRPDIAPDWLASLGSQSDTLEQAIYDFVDRHEHKRLRRHASRGNINGMENFLDIFTTLVRLLYVYHVRGVVCRSQLVPRVSHYIAIATWGFETSDDASDGYLRTIVSNIGDTAYLQQVCTQLNFVGHLRAAFAIAQRVRFVPGEPSVRAAPLLRASEALPSLRARLRQAIASAGLKEPAVAEVMSAVEGYKVFSSSELAQMKKELVI